MTNNSDINRIVMRRVRVVRAVRPFLSNAAAAVVLLGVSLYLLGREVFVAQVFRNIPATDPMVVLRFFEAAFLNTNFVVQTLTAFAALAGLWLARECVRMLRLTGKRLV